MQIYSSLHKISPTKGPWINYILKKLTTSFDIPGFGFVVFLQSALDNDIPRLPLMGPVQVSRNLSLLYMLVGAHVKWAP